MIEILSALVLSSRVAMQEYCGYPEAEPSARGCWAPGGGDGGAAGHESGGGYDIPEPPMQEQEICDEDTATCDDEDGQEREVDVPWCRKKDEQIDETAREVGARLREACFGGDGPEYERGVLIYADGTVGSFCVGNEDGYPDPNAINFNICGDQDVNQRDIDVVAFMHCGASWPTPDQQVIDNFGNLLKLRGMGYNAST